MTEAYRSRAEGRAGAVAGVALVHALLAWALITGLGFDVVSRVTDDLKVFSIPAEPPPPPVEGPVPPKKRTAEREGAASPPNLRSHPSPVIAPPPKIRLKVPPPVRTAAVPTPVPPGSDPSAGAAAVPGPGSGSGGIGVGTGSGGRGNGPGGGGIARRAELIRGRLVNEDYPRAALRAGIEGSVSVRFTVGTDGRASGCSVSKSSGHAELDETTCRLIERRFVYRPAQDMQGNPIPEVVSKIYDWILPFRSR